MARQQLKFDLNLSAREFVAYLDCKLKCFIMKELAQGTKRGPRGKRDYSRFPEHIGKGMFYHEQFANFHATWGDWIHLGKEPPTFVLKDPILHHFWQYEVQRFKTGEEDWFPLATEHYLESNYLRGTIDRIDKISTASCRVTEYKASPSAFDQQEILFYASLVSKCQAEMRDLFGIRTSEEEVVVEEIAVYYYQQAAFPRQLPIEKLAPEALPAFDRFFEAIRAEINLARWEKKKHCQEHTCLYKRICQAINL